MAKILCQAQLPSCNEVTDEIEGRVLVSLGRDPDGLVAKLTPPLFVCPECAAWARNCGGSVIRYTSGLRLRVEVLGPDCERPRKRELAELFDDRRLTVATLAWAKFRVGGILWGAGWRNAQLEPKVQELLAPAAAALSEGDFGSAVERAEAAVAAARQLFRQRFS